MCELRYGTPQRALAAQSALVYLYMYMNIELDLLILSVRACCECFSQTEHLSECFSYCLL